ncbi:conserved hypothetical protein [Talaromyces stipitatus ATCC 10500]|uniref:Uncharacterized protein n=1 Tax=Talaromyces stipitatus (strain ATCC 10500 / CBS 375.48 / QM 6759 / NRRL 1006) TaxID=441959 RepID=B8MRD7_TALSN|nr:uncharacterized protein TSTA_055370 [Talaromyces stipitatus ATCC 10500]EED13032.1 conserved hypothetical protein [Talaromyces stipitatus ATCC 10500]
MDKDTKKKDEMLSKPANGIETKGSDSSEGDIPILLPRRYHPDFKGNMVVEEPQTESAPASPTCPRQTRWSFTRTARGVVESLLPEPLRPRYVNEQRPVMMEALPANLVDARKASIYDAVLHPPRPSSSVYEDDDRWPDLTTSSGSTWHYEGNSSGINTARNVRRHNTPRPGQLNTHKPLPLDPPNVVNLRREQSQYLEGSSFHQSSRPQTVFPGSSYLDDPQPIQECEETRSSLHTLDQSQTSSNNQQGDMYSQLAALRVNFSRRHSARLPDADDLNEKAPLLQTSESTNLAKKEHVPFDPIDPYHHSGQPKKKVLYGPAGYLGKSKDWKNSNLQRMTEKVESLGHRVKRGIQRTLERDPDDNRMELLHGIVMKPSISINVDPEAQSEIYSKLELFLCMSANSYLLVQLQNNRFVGNDSIKRFVNSWKSRNRPVVPEFQFDMKTQRDIIVHNLRTFEFPGRYGLDPVLLRGTLDAWGSVISQLNVRSYCWPDSAIRKLFHDVEPILEMLGASREVLATFLQIKQVVVAIVQQAKYKRKMEQLKLASSLHDPF